MSLGAGLHAALGSDKPNLKLQTLIKNKALQEQIDSALGSSKKTLGLSEDAIGGFMDRWATTQPRYTEFAERDISRIGDIYSGRLETQLADLRRGQREARLGATESALRRARGSDTARAAATGLPGGSSYRNLMEARIMNDIMTQAALEDESARRADFGYLQQMQLGNLGQQQAILQAMEGREMVPLQFASTARGIPLQNMRQIQALDEANKMHSVYRKRDWMERTADAEQAIKNSISQDLAITGQAMNLVGGFMGMGGGGGGMPMMGGGGGGGGGGVQPPPRVGAQAQPIPQSAPAPAPGSMWSGTPYYNPSPITYNPGYGW